MFQKRFSCAFCGNHTTEILDYGTVALAGGFLKPEQFATEEKYPLSLHFCERCYAVQIPQHISPEKMFSNYFYFTSATNTMRKHFVSYANEIVRLFNPKSVVEIGCNDGGLLSSLADHGIKVTGIDPASNVVKSITDKRIKVINSFFNETISKEIGKVDIVIANNVFAHISKIHEATLCISNMLTDNGVFILEVNKLHSMITDLQYDWVYHEHLYYYSTIALQRHLRNHGLEIFDMQNLQTHGGSARYYVCKSKKRPITKSVTTQIERELWMGLDKIDRFMKFSDSVKQHRVSMREFMGQIDKKRVAGYGACGRTNTMIQYCNLELDYIVDDAKAKQGFYTPGSHIPIVDRGVMDKANPDVVIVFAWSFIDEISSKVSNSRLVVPLPYIYDVKEWAVA
jgi:SAM-dependent methyltransferase